MTVKDIPMEYVSCLESVSNWSLFRPILNYLCFYKFVSTETFCISLQTKTCTVNKRFSGKENFQCNISLSMHRICKLMLHPFGVNLVKQINDTKCDWSSWYNLIRQWCWLVNSNVPLLKFNSGCSLMLTFYFCSVSSKQLTRFMRNQVVLV